MTFNFNAFMEALPIMGKGMLGILVVTVVIIAGIYLLNAVTGAKKGGQHKEG